MVLDAGDFLFKPNIAITDCELDRARLILDLYRQMGYRAVAIGLHDLAAGTGFLQEELGKRGIAGLPCNIKENGKSPFAAYKIFKLDGIRIAIVGATSPGRGEQPWQDFGIKIEDPMKSLHKLIPRLRKKADCILLLSNLGLATDTWAAADMNNIDVIIGSGNGGGLARPLKREFTYILRTNAKGKTIGRATLVFSHEKRLQKVEGNLIRLTGKIKADPSTSSKIEKFEKKCPEDARRTRRIKRRPRRNVSGTNPFIQAIENAKKKDKSVQKNNGPVHSPGTNPLLEILKDKAKQNKDSKATAGTNTQG